MLYLAQVLIRVRAEADVLRKYLFTIFQAFHQPFSMRNSYDKACTEAGIINLFILFTKGIRGSKIKAFTWIIPQ